MPDANLAAVVRDELNLAPNAPITRQALHKLTSLEGDKYGVKMRLFRGQIKDLTGLEHATQLQIVYLRSHHISDLGPLAGLTQLRRLIIDFNPINDFSPLAGLTQLRWLWVTVRSVALMNNLRRHVDLTQLERLSIEGGGNRIGDLGPFANLTQLEHFFFNRAQIHDVTPLAGLTQLEALRLNGNEIRDVTPLAGLTQLRSLGLSRNEIRDVTPLTGFTQLESLYLGGNEIRDVTPLAGFTQLKELYIVANEIRDVTPLAGFTQLENLHLSNNQIPDVTPLAGLTQLKYLDLRDNQITDVTPIQHLIDSANTRVLLEGNPIGEQPEGEADLVVTVVKAAHFGTTDEKRFASPEQKFALYVTVQNQGTEQSDRTKLIFYRSTDRNITTDDQQVGDPMDVVPLAPQRPVTLTLYPVAPRTAGTYYYGACIADNKCSTQTAKLTVTRQPELRISSIKVGPKEASPDAMKKKLTVAPGGPFDLLINILNEGDRRSDATTVRFYRSKDAQIPTNDREIRNAAIEIEKVEPGKPLEKRRRWRAPNELGTYYYGACVDTIVSERNPNNNCSDTVEITVIETVIEPCDRPKVHVIWCYPNDVSPDVWVNAGRAVNINTVPGIMTAVHDYYSKEVHRLTKKQVAFDLDYNNNGLPYEIKLSSAETELAMKDFDEIYNMIIINWKHIHGEWLPDSKDFYVAIVQSQNDSLQAGGGPFSGVVSGVARGNFTAVATGNYGIGIAGLNIGKEEAVTQDGIAQVIAHELGHLFGLDHVFKPDNIMGYERAGTLNANHLKADHAEWISAHAAFNSCPIPSSSKTVLALPTSRYQPSWVTRPRLTGNSKTYHIGFKDPDEIYTIQLSIGVGKDQDSAVKDIEFIKMSYKSGTTVVLEILQEVLEIESNFFNSNDTVMLALSILDKRGDVTTEWYNLSNILRPLQLYQLADVDGNGKVDQKDVALVSEIVEGTKPPDDAADVNGDGNITDADVTLVKQVIAERADIDENGKVDQEDVAFVREIVEGTKPPDDAADVNGDGEVTDADVDLVKQVINMKKDVESPAAPLQVSLLPKETALLVNYPNPFNPETWIPYQLAESADVTLTIYNIQGHVVRDLDLGHQRAGMYHSRNRAAHWDGRNAQGESVASGVYFYTLTAGDFTATRKLLIRK